MNQTPVILSVTQVNTLVKGLLDSVPALQNVCVRGEISNYKLYPSGHHYFRLKDAESSLGCVLFKGSAFSLRFRPQNGMSVLAVGRLTAYPRDGVYQLVCSRLLPEGAGELSLAFEQLKKKLYEEGLFDPARKKPLPVYAHRICIITSESGAAVHDMLRILGKRYPLAKAILIPVRVQGETAAGEIAHAIGLANRLKLADLIIVGRGGGSLEDLWAFNEEIVARAIAASNIPVISAVGHEPDVTISDFAADLRAATPSNAAELAVPDRQELQKRLSAAQKALCAALQSKTQEARGRLRLLESSRYLRDPTCLLQDRRQHLDGVTGRLAAAQSALLERGRKRLSGLASSLDAMSPLKVLARGYAYVTDGTERPVSSAAALTAGMRIGVRFADGSAAARVEEITIQGEQNDAEIQIQEL